MIPVPTVCASLGCIQTIPIGFNKNKARLRFCRKCRLDKFVSWYCEVDGCTNIITNVTNRETKRVCDSCYSLGRHRPKISQKINLPLRI